MASAQHAGLLLQAVGASRDVQKKVKGPGEKLVENKGEELVDRSILEELELEKRLLKIVAAGLGDKCHVLLHVTSVHMVAMV